MELWGTEKYDVSDWGYTKLLEASLHCSFVDMKESIEYDWTHPEPPEFTQLTCLMCFFSSSGHHCSVWRETVLLHGSDCRPVAVVHVHRCGRAAVGTGETRTRTSSILFWKKNGIDANLFWEQTYWEEDEEVDTLHEVCGSKLLPVTLALMQGCHHNHRHGNELSTWKQRDSCLRAQRENKLSVSVPLWIHTCTQTHHYMHDPVNMYAHTHTHTGLESIHYTEEAWWVQLEGRDWEQRRKDADRSRSEVCDLF